MFRLLMLAALVSGCVDDATASDTQETTATRGSNDHRPPEAVDACATGSAGGACAFDHDGHPVTRQGPDDGPLACAPDRPPPEAFDACASSTAGAACAFDVDGHHVAGTCRQGPDGQGPLGCAPDQRC
jgi:hypothetical protein